MRQYAGYGSAAETNQRFKYLLANGQTGLSVAFDLPTQMGMDSDHPLALGEVGKVGVAIDTLQDMETLLDGIPLNSVSISMTINATAAILLAMVVAVAKKQGIARTRVAWHRSERHSEGIHRERNLHLPSPLLSATDHRSDCSTARSNCRTGTRFRSAAITSARRARRQCRNWRSRLRTRSTYAQAAMDKGMDFDAFAPRLSFFFNTHNDFLEEIAKFRAASSIWARIAKERFHAKNPRSMMLRFHAQTAGSTLTAQQPDNNIVRVALQALAAVLGGAQSLHTNSKDEALALPTADAARLALRTQQIIAWESGVTNTVDPVGGSEALETMTENIERQVFELLGSIEHRGGMLAAIESGWVQSQIQDSAYAYQRSIETRRAHCRGRKSVSGP